MTRSRTNNLHNPVLAPAALTEDLDGQQLRSHSGLCIEGLRFQHLKKHWACENRGCECYCHGEWGLRKSWRRP